MKRPTDQTLDFVFGTLAVLAVVFCFTCGPCQSRGAEPSPILAVRQSGYLTHGAIVASDLRGSLILTTKHGRNPRDPWRAGKLSGTRTILDPHHDLALLVTTAAWPGPVLELATEEPAMPVVFLHGPNLPRTFPWGCPMTVSDLPCRVGDGSSGLPLIVGGRVAGVRVGPTLEGRAAYVTRAAVERFLREVRR